MGKGQPIPVSFRGRAVGHGRSEPVHQAPGEHGTGQHSGQGGAGQPPATAHLPGHQPAPAQPHNQYDSVHSPFGEHHVSSSSSTSAAAHSAAGGRPHQPAGWGHAQAAPAAPAAGASGRVPFGGVARASAPAAARAEPNHVEMHSLPAQSAQFAAAPSQPAAMASSSGAYHQTSLAATGNYANPNLVPVHVYANPLPAQGAAVGAAPHQAPAAPQYHAPPAAPIPGPAGGAPHQAPAAPQYHAPPAAPIPGPAGGAPHQAPAAPQYHAPPAAPIPGPAGGAPHQAPAGGAGQPPAGGAGQPPAGGAVQPPAVVHQPVEQNNQPGRFRRIRDAIGRNPKKSGLGLVLVVAAIAGTALGLTRPWEKNDVGTGTGMRGATPPTAKNGGKTLAKGVSLTDESLLALVAPGVTEAGFAINPASFLLYRDGSELAGVTTLVTNEGTWTASAEGKLSFIPAAAFMGGEAKVFFTVADLMAVRSSRATFTIQYGPKLSQGLLKDQDIKAGPFTFTVTEKNAAAPDGVFEPRDMAATSKLDLASIRLFASGSDTAQLSLDEPLSGTWTAANGAITFKPVSGLMAQMVTVAFTASDLSGQVSNRALLTVTFKPETVIVDPDNKEKMRIPRISANVQFVVSAQTAAVPISADIPIDAASVRFVSGASRVSTRDFPGMGTWTASGLTLTFTPEFGFRGAPPAVSVVANSMFGVESTPFDLALNIFPLPITADDFIASTYPAKFDPLANDKVGYALEGNALDRASVQIYAAISSKPGFSVSSDRKSANSPGEGDWAVLADGTMTFTALAGFTSPPKPVAYTVDDTKGSRSDPAVITINRQVGTIATQFAAMLNMTDAQFYAAYVSVLSDASKKYTKFDELDITNQLMLMFITEAQRLNQYAPVQSARMALAGTLGAVTIVDEATDTALMAWKNAGFSIQGLVNSTATINDTLLGPTTVSAPIGIRALRLEVMADLIERYISLMMLMRGKA